MAKSPVPPSRPAQPSPALAQASKLLQEGKPQQAKPLLQKYVAKAPSDLTGVTMLRVAHTQLGEFDQALYYAQRAHAIAPDHPEVRGILGAALADAGRIDEARTTLLGALELAPNHQPSMAALAQIHQAQGRHEDAAQMAARALGLGLTPILARTLAISLVHLGQPDQAVDALKRVLAQTPGDPALLSLLCDTMLHAPGVQPQDAAAAHFAFGRLLQQQANMRADLPARDMSPDRPLRVGLIGSAFRSGLLEPLLRSVVGHLDPHDYKLHVYQHGPEDAATEWFKTRPGVRYAHIARFQPVNICQRVAGDQIDVLIDTTGHHDPAVLMAMHLRPAPAQATWLGYPFSTGVTSIDERFVDAETDPDGSERLGTEKLRRLDPCSLCYDRPDPADLPAIVPGDPARPLTLASIAAGPRLNDATIRAWVAAARRLSNARLLIADAALALDAPRAALRQRILAAGFAEDRLELVPLGAGQSDRLGLLARVDIALDTFPMPGPVLAIEAALMGVPTVGCTGPSGAHRSAASTMKLLGLDHLVARDADAFVENVAALAADRHALAGLRAGLRDRALSSPLLDGPGFSARFGQAVRELWKARVAG